MRAADKQQARKRRNVEKKQFRIPTADYLSNVALHYLAKFAASEAGLRRVLENRIRRAAMTNEMFAADKEAQGILKQAIERIIERHVKSGVLNDAAFAAMKTRSLRRGGGSARVITQKLQMKGLAKDVIAAALVPEEGMEKEDVERAAALAFAKKRGLGAFRKKAVTDEVAQKRKDFAAMARAGFGFGVAGEVLGGESSEEAFDD